MNLNANDDTDKRSTKDFRKLGWIKGNRRKEKQLFRCKRGCPEALYRLLTNNGVTTYESTCQHQHKSILKFNFDI